MSEATPELQAKEDAFCKVMDATEQYLELRGQLSEILKKGYFELTQAKYSIGMENVGPLKYSTEMSAIQRFKLAEEDGDWKVEEMPREAAVSESETMDVTKRRDPIGWFGMSVPQSLRDAQRSFQRALPLIVELANHAHSMNRALEISQSRADRNRDDRDETSI